MVVLLVLGASVIVVNVLVIGQVLAVASSWLMIIVISDVDVFIIAIVACVVGFIVIVMRRV